MKTLICFSSNEEVFFTELNGDYSHLKDVIMNTGCNINKENELMDLLYDKAGEFKIKKLDEPTRDWDVFIHAGAY